MSANTKIQLSFVIVNHSPLINIEVNIPNMITNAFNFYHPSEKNNVVFNWLVRRLKLSP